MESPTVAPAEKPAAVPMIMPSTSPIAQPVRQCSVALSAIESSSRPCLGMAWWSWWPAASMPMMLATP